MADPQSDNTSFSDLVDEAKKANQRDYSAEDYGPAEK